NKFMRKIKIVEILSSKRMQNKQTEVYKKTKAIQKNIFNLLAEFINNGLLTTRKLKNTLQ
ncbi:hypothetical protein, partial [Escherichia coli]|uniref:hypothetical protein n=1 Tax=Escherichia coli TaxID=562 RepID=UPI001A7E0683